MPPAPPRRRCRPSGRPGMSSIASPSFFRPLSAAVPGSGTTLTWRSPGGKGRVSCQANRLHMMQSALAARWARGYGGEGTLHGAVMRSSRQPRSAHGAGHAPGPGAIVRRARMAQGLSLADFGARVGYSAAQVSRYERGIAPLTDITLLRRFAAALALPPSCSASARQAQRMPRDTP